MDGTLTIAVHDFDAIRATLGLPPGKPILEALAALPVEEAEPLYLRLDELELELARDSTPQAGAKELLGGLRRRGATLGILTRNSVLNAHETLKACDLLDFFEPACILGRESVLAPKPDPDGIHKLLAHWNAPSNEAVIVGDFLFDLQAGRRAGVATVHLDVNGDGGWPEQTDFRVQNLNELRKLAVA